jgi:hypothetical protein
MRPNQVCTIRAARTPIGEGAGHDRRRDGTCSRACGYPAWLTVKERTGQHSRNDCDSTDGASSSRMQVAVATSGLCCPLVRFGMFLCLDGSSTGSQRLARKSAGNGRIMHFRPQQCGPNEDEMPRPTVCGSVAGHLKAARRGRGKSGQLR